MFLLATAWLLLGLSFDPAEELRLSCAVPLGVVGIPDPATATEAEFVASQQAVRAFDAAITAYTRCLADADAHLSSAHPESTAALQDAKVSLHNAAIDRSEKLVSEFNQALERFRVRDVVPAQFQGMVNGRDRVECKAELQSIPFGDIRMRLKISATGEVQEVQFSRAFNEAAQEALRCVIGNARFLPATRKGVPEASELTLPVDMPWIGQGMNAFRKQNVEMSLIQVVQLSDDAHIARGVEVCRPEKMRDGGSVKLVLTVNTNGRVERSYVSKSSGSRQVDDVAGCVAKWLKFKPGVVNGRRVELESIDWTIEIPPR